MSYSEKIRRLGRHEYDTKSRDFHRGAHKNWPGGAGFNPNNVNHKSLLLNDTRSFRQTGHCFPKDNPNATF